MNSQHSVGADHCLCIIKVFLTVALRQLAENWRRNAQSAALEVVPFSGPASGCNVATRFGLTVRIVCRGLQKEAAVINIITPNDDETSPLINIGQWRETHTLMVRLASQMVKFTLLTSLDNPGQCTGEYWPHGHGEKKEFEVIE